MPAGRAALRRTLAMPVQGGLPSAMKDHALPAFAGRMRGSPFKAMQKLYKFSVTLNRTAFHCRVSGMLGRGGPVFSRNPGISAFRIPASRPAGLGGYLARRTMRPAGKFLIGLLLAT